MGEFRNVLYFLRLNMESRINEANLDVMICGAPIVLV